MVSDANSVVPHYRCHLIVTAGFSCSQKSKATCRTSKAFIGFPDDDDNGDDDDDDDDDDDYYYYYYYYYYYLQNVDYFILTRADKDTTTPELSNIIAD